MVSALLLALIAALQSSGTAAAQVQQPPPAVGNVPAPAAPSSVALDAEQARADQELEQRVLAGRERVVVRGEHAPELLANYCADAIELLFANAVHLATLRELDARIALARDAAARTADENQRLRVEHEYASALSETDPQKSLAVLRAAVATYPRATQLLIYSQALLYELSVRAGEWDAADKLFGVLSEALDARMTSARATGSAQDLLATLGLRVETLAQRVTQCCRLGLLDLGFVENDKLVAAASELQETDEALARSSGNGPVLDEAVASAWIDTRFAGAFLCLTCQDYVGLLSAVEALDASKLPLGTPEQRLRDYYRAFAHSELQRTGQVADLELPERLYSEAIASAAQDSGSDVPLTALELDLSIGLVDLHLRRHDLAAAEKRLALVEQGLLQTGLSGFQESLSRARIVALRSRLARAQGADHDALASIRDELERAYDEFLLSVENTIPRRGGLGFLHWGSYRELISECIETELALDPSDAGKRRALELALLPQKLGTFARRLGLHGVTLDDIRQRLLGEHDGLVVVLPTLERTHVFLVDRSNLAHFHAEDRPRLLGRARRFASIVGAQPDPSDMPLSERRERLQHAGRELSEALFAPDARRLIDQWKGLYSCGFELLESPPIEALPWRGEVPLGCVFATASLSSLPVTLWSLDSPRAGGSPTSDLLLVSSPVHGAFVQGNCPDLQPLVLAPDEVLRLRAGFEETRVLHLAGSRATLAELASKAHDCSALLEIFGHGVPSMNRERPAAIALSASAEDQGLVDCDWIESHLVPPPFVSLFACEAALGPSRLGDDTAAQLGDALLFKGARCVLLSRSRLSLGAMLALDVSLHAHFADPNATPAEALRRAREDMRLSKEWSDPFYFGTVSLLGAGLDEVPALRVAFQRPQGPVHDSPEGPWWAWVMGVLALGMLAPTVRRLRARRDASAGEGRLRE